MKKNPTSLESIMDWDENGLVNEANEKSQENTDEQHSADLENEMEKVRDIRRRKGPAAAIFHVKESVLGGKLASAVPTVINDPVSGVEIFNPERIKEASVQYCKNLLTNRPPK